MQSVLLPKFPKKKTKKNYFSATEIGESKIFDETTELLKIGSIGNISAVPETQIETLIKDLEQEINTFNEILESNHRETTGKNMDSNDKKITIQNLLKSTSHK